MRQALYKIPVFVVVMAMALSSVGPLLDHHFAERQPGHIHVGADGFTEHTHAYESGVHTHAQNGDFLEYPVAFYNYDAGPFAATVGFIADTAMDSFRQYEPTSVFVLPSSANVLVKNNYSSPPGKPPRHIA